MLQEIVFFASFYVQPFDPRSAEISLYNVNMEEVVNGLSDTQPPTKTPYCMYVEQKDPRRGVRDR